MRIKYNNLKNKRIKSVHNIGIETYHNMGCRKVLHIK